jgi:hypothetical protein
MILDMKTIAISIEESMLARLRELAAASIGEDRANRQRRRSISELVREALRDYLGRCEKRRREESDRLAFARHRKMLRKQLATLVDEQAEP